MEVRSSSGTLKQTRSHKKETAVVSDDGIHYLDVALATNLGFPRAKEIRIGVGQIQD